MQYEQLPSITPITTTTTSSWATYENNNSNMDVKKVKSEKPVEKSKRKQVKNACGKIRNFLLLIVTHCLNINNTVNCQKACKKCDDGRPCKRCIKLGLTATCRNSDRKERKKGVKRGPYKKRQAYNKDKPGKASLIA
jgi:hypothetical protein